MGDYQHEKAAIMQYIFKQATPLTGAAYLKSGDYIQRLLENRVPQLLPKEPSLKQPSNLDPIKLTSDLYRKDTKPLHPSGQSYSPVVDRPYSPTSDFFPVHSQPSLTYGERIY